MNVAYDSALKEIELTKRELDEYLQRQRKRLGSRVSEVRVYELLPLICS